MLRNARIVGVCVVGEVGVAWMVQPAKTSMQRKAQTAGDLDMVLRIAFGEMSFEYRETMPAQQLEAWLWRGWTGRAEGVYTNRTPDEP